MFAALLVPSLIALPPEPASGPVVQVIVSCPNRSAAEADEAVLGPLVRQLVGAEGVARVEGQARGGAVRATVRFVAGTDPDRAAALLRQRVAAAEPLLPAAVRRLGVTVQTDDPDELPAYWLAVGDGGPPSPGLTAAVRGPLRDRAARLVGVRDARIFGGRAIGLDIRVDPDRLAAFGLTAAEVGAALRKQAVRADAPDRAGEVVVADRGGGRAVRLADVAAVRVVERPAGLGWLDGSPAVVLAVWPTTGRPDAAAIDKLVKDSSADLPAGATVTLAGDLSGADRGGYALVEVRLPPGAGHTPLLATAAAAARTAAGRPRVLAVADPALPDEATLLVRYEPGRPTDLAALRNRLGEVQAVTARVLDLSGPGPRTTRFPVELALSGPDRKELRRWAEALGDRLAADRAAADVRFLGGEDAPGVQVDIDRAKAKALGLTADAVAEAVAAALSPEVTPAVGPGVTMAIDGRGGPADRLRVARLKNADGRMVPLATVVTVRETVEPAVARRVGPDPAVVVSANPPAGLSPAAAAERVRLAAEAVRKELGLPAGYKSVDLAAR